MSSVQWEILYCIIQQSAVFFFCWGTNAQCTWHMHFSHFVDNSISCYYSLLHMENLKALIQAGASLAEANACRLQLLMRMIGCWYRKCQSHSTEGQKNCLRQSEGHCMVDDCSRNQLQQVKLTYNTIKVNCIRRDTCSLCNTLLISAKYDYSTGCIFSLFRSENEN